MSSHSLMNAAVARREHRFLRVLHQPVVLGVEDVVDGGQADVFVAAAVAGDEVRVEQLVVVEPVRIARIAEADFDVAVRELAIRHRLMGDVVQEGVAGAHCEVRDVGRDPIGSSGRR